jgi:UPF0755 protein
MARRRRSGCGGLLAAAVLVAIGLAAVPLWLWYGPGPAPKPITVQVAGGATIAGTARRLEAAGAIRSATWFRRLAARLGSDDPIRAGEFEIPARASAATVLDTLQHARPVQHFVTIPEGMPSVLVARRLRAERLLTGPVAVPAEGSVLPDSYSFERGETRAAVLRRMQAAMRKTLSAAWKARKPGIAVSTPEQAVTLASIVEKETGVAAERRTVAGVYSNRLRQGMPLQADPTVIYPVTKGLPLGRRIRQSELRNDNGYNTYARAGLPVGPIANPGRSSILAVLDPARTQALYFVADGKGGHVFANTLAEHNANVAKWYAVRRARGEM